MSPQLRRLLALAPVLIASTPVFQMIGWPAHALAQSTLFSDTFNRTTGLGANWFIGYGTFTTDGTYAISGAPPINGNWASVVPSLGADEYSVSADIIIPAGPSSPVSSPGAPAAR